jgi:hypothetical protein
MILDHAQLVDEQNAALLFSESASSVCLLQMEPQDSLRKVFDLLRRQEKPVFLLLPAYGDAFRQPAHFIALRHLLAEGAHPPFLCLVIPSRRTQETVLATRYSIQHASSVEDALQSLVHSSLPKETEKRYEEPVSQTSKQGQTTEELRREEIAVLQSAPTFIRGSKKRPYLLGAGSIVLLFVASAILLPFMLFTPTHSQLDAAVNPLGTLVFTSSDQFNPRTTEGYNDIITLSLRSIPTPPADMFYYAWLMPDQSDDATVPLLLGTLHGGPVNLTYISPKHTNLLAFYSGVRITVQPSGSTPETPSQDPTSWRWEGFIPNIPTPGDEDHYSLLNHLRHLLAKDPTLQANQLPGGLALWLTRNISKIEEWASAAQGDWNGPQTSDDAADQIHRHMLRILEYLDGMFYYTRDVPVGSPWLVDPLAGKIGLLDSVQSQNPPAFLTHVDIHLTGLESSPGHTAQQKLLAIFIDNVITRMKRDLKRVHDDAASLVKMNRQQLKQLGNQATLDDMATLTTEVKSGWFDPSTGENIGGVLWIMARLQQLTTIPINASRQMENGHS